MDGSRFDTLARLIALARSRRALLKSVMAPALIGLGAASLLDVGETDAKKKKKKRKKCKKSGAACSSDKQCCSKKKLICDVPTNASNSDTKCCGGDGSTCGGVNSDGDALPPLCCIGEAGVNEFVCSENDPDNPNTPGTCVPAEA